MDAHLRIFPALGVVCLLLRGKLCRLRVWLRGNRLYHHGSYLLRQAPERVLQFGEGNFLRGFADHFIDVMNERAGFNGKVVVVPPASTGKAARINAQEGLYQLCLRGKYDGAVVNDRRVISCISRGLDVFTDWEELLRTARSPALRFVISNTTEAGIQYVKGANTYPAKVLRLLKARDGAVAIRTMVINQMRGFAKSMGFRLEKCSAGRFHLLNKAEWQTDFESLTFPLMDILETVALKIKAFDSMIEDLAGAPEFKPMVERCRQVYGVGKIGSVAFVAIIGGNPNRFEHARDVGPYLGLVPKQDQSGESEKQKRMTKHGSKLVRKLLMECAKIAKKDCAKDTDLKLKAMRISRSGGKAARNKATAAVARGLAVVMMALLKNPARKYVPLSERGRLELERLQRENETIEAMRMAS